MLLLCLCGQAVAYNLNYGTGSLPLTVDKKTFPSLAVQIGETVYYGALFTYPANPNTIRLDVNGTLYWAGVYCAAGTYSAKGHEPCSACGAGYYCTGGLHRAACTYGMVGCPGANHTADLAPTCSSDQCTNLTAAGQSVSDAAPGHNSCHEGGMLAGTYRVVLGGGSYPPNALISAIPGQERLGPAELTYQFILPHPAYYQLCAGEHGGLSSTNPAEGGGGGGSWMKVIMEGIEYYFVAGGGGGWPGGGGGGVGNGGAAGSTDGCHGAKGAYGGGSGPFARDTICALGDDARGVGGSVDMYGVAYPITINIINANGTTGTLTSTFGASASAPHVAAKASHAANTAAESCVQCAKLYKVQ